MANPVQGTYEGKQDHIRELQTPDVEVFKNIYEDKNYKIRLKFPEFTAICPKTGLPDFGTVFIEYVPDKVCLELKSLKEYFLFYRDVGIFHENVVNKILDDLVAVASPRKMKVKVTYRVRGGIKTTVCRKYKK
ncbi:MAG: NADPH-dependent 7-cyano-7-deazaguanine reductase QueF [Candidatus Hydrogenedentota bacterium]|nr:MAG: NADPH-dependent 7-cyano-7-deazaguanine reductase QueF [Candidatus Hydrogenedentota bacterium]